MAKTKTSPPKKTKKSTPVKETVTAPRRSPRKAVQSAKKLAIQETVTTEVSKRTPKTKATAVAKTSAKSATKTVTALKVTKSPSPKENAPPSAKTDPPSSPKRGRPKKATKFVPPKSKTRTPSESRISSLTRSETPPDLPEAPALDIGNEWTDSPKKRSPAKTSTTTAVSKTASGRKAASQKVTKATANGIRKSIELPEANSRDRSSSTARGPSASPVRGRSRTTSSSKAAMSSKVYNTGSTRAQSRSPVRRASKTAATALALSRVSASPKKDELASPEMRVSSRSRSPVKAGVDSPSKRASSRSRSPAKAKVDTAKRRGPSRSRSPVKADGGSSRGRAPSRSRSPAKLQQRDVYDELSTTVQPARTRSKSPNKADSRKSSQMSSEDVVIPPPILSPRPRGRPRSSSTVRPPSPLQINKTRNSRSPTKASQNGARKSRSASPKKPEKGAAVARRRSDLSPAIVRRRATSPSKTQAQRDEDYDIALQDIEDMAYSSDLSGVKTVHSPLIGPNQRRLAIERGIQRAELQRRLRAKGGFSKDQVRGTQSAKLDQYRETTNDLEDTLDELSSSEESRIRQRSPRHNATAAQIGSPGRASTSSERCRSSVNSLSSQKRGPSKSRPSSSRSPSRASEDTSPPQAGKPSEKGRGTVHSVTNGQLIRGTNRKNPFFETMPGPEVWHRRMPPFLPFGETPFMEREMSRQISEDLAKGAEKPNQGWLAALNPFSKAKQPPSEQRTHISSWALPDVGEQEVNVAMGQVAKFTSSGAPPASPKRKASEQLSRSPVKKARRRSQSNEPRMSGALQ